MSTMAMPQPTASEAAVRYLITNYSPKGNKVGWLMMASILVEAWDLYSIAFVLIFIKEQYNPDPLMLGLAAAGTQGGALLGALLGGWLSDKIGRRVMFLITMVMFIVLALAQAVVPRRRLARGDPLPARRSARLRHLDRLHLHHGIHGQG
ncbi:putative MFS family arabinose efflux permease [Bradyrhizobium sp. LM2.9]